MDDDDDVFCMIGVVLRKVLVAFPSVTHEEEYPVAEAAVEEAVGGIRTPVLPLPAAPPRGNPRPLVLQNSSPFDMLGSCLNGDLSSVR